MNLKTDFPAEFFQQRDIPAAFMAENKVRADANGKNPAKIARQFADENFAGFFAEGFVEGNFQQRVRAERFDGAQFLRTGINLRRRFFRRDDGARMPVEGCDHRQRVVLARVGNGLPDDLLMAEMHAVEHADGQADLATAVAQLTCGADDVHNFFSHRFSQMKHKFKMVLSVFHLCPSVAV